MSPRMRSALFVPGDGERKLAKAAGSDADWLILDLEDAVAPAQRETARALVCDALSAPTAPQRCVRVNPIDTSLAAADLAAVMPARPDAIMQPKVRTPADIFALDEAIAAHERTLSRPVGSTGLIALVTETPQMALALATLDRLPARVLALTWGGEDLSAALGASRRHDDDGRWAFTYRLARSQTLLAARACGVLALDTLYADFRDGDGLRDYAVAARRDGFDGMLAIHPAQVGVINTAFTPDADELAHARRVIAAFDAEPDAGAVQLDGVMLDRPHRLLAERLIARSSD